MNTELRSTVAIEENYGVRIEDTGTYFNFWITEADEVVVNLAKSDDSSAYAQIELEETKPNHWRKKLSDQLHGHYYWLEIERDAKIETTVDPWVRAVGTNSQRGIIVDLKKTDPPGWHDDTRPTQASAIDAVIYELHVRDFSIDEQSGIKNKGQYLAFTERGTENKKGYRTGIDHLKELGITHVQLLPIFDFATVDDTDPGEYNWGYDPLYYNVPEGSYASNPSDLSRIKELKQLIQSLHNEGIGVIMDVVYNHTYYFEEAAFNKIAPGYFYRWHKEEVAANGSGVGNEIATEKEQVRKFIVDSVKYWASEYHLDGFRFDLMGLIDRNTMIEIKQEIEKIDSSIMVYGEPWYALPPQLDESELMIKGAQQHKEIAVFNDDYRNAIKGENDFSSQGFIGGHNSLEHEIKKGIVGQTNFSKIINGFAFSPVETINYVSCHDNLSLWDKIQSAFPGVSKRIKIRLDRMAQAIILTSQGIPFIYGGEEFLRTKYGNDNSYNAGDRINRFKWERKSEHYNTVKYYQGLIQLRKNHPAFRLRSQQEIKRHLSFLASPAGTIAFKLGPHAREDSWSEIVVIYNSWWDWAKINLPKTVNWNIVVDDVQAGIEPFNCFYAGEVDVPPHSVMVLYTND
ncbi:MAG: type I pullulanase [Bacillota bacterium]